MDKKDFLLRKQKWEENMRNYTVGPSRLATYSLEVQNTLNLLEGKREGLLLDIGCGFGEPDIHLAKHSNFTIVACDISEFALRIARENVERAGLTKRIRVEQADVYNLHYADNYFDVAISFGYVSAATYSGVQREVARVLKPGGFLICDFINPFCLYKIVKVLAIYKKLIGGRYNGLTLGNIASNFKEHNLQFISQKLFNTYPPVNFLSEKQLLFFENNFGKFLSRVLGRVRLVCFQKR